ncbi:MAG: 30S ribosomal protein S6e [Candidatus Anstonellales archaeon]
MKMNIGTEEGKTYTLEIPKEKEILIVGKRIGEVIEGNDFGLPGYKLKLTGGSDSSGIPMRGDVSGQRTERVLLSKGPGIRPKRKGERKRKSVRGGAFSAATVQINVQVVEKGGVALEEILGKKDKKEGEK